MSAARLEELLEEVYQTPGTPEEQSQFRITDSDMANWALRKLRHIAAERQALVEQADREKERITRWLTRGTKSLDEQEAFFTGHLRAYHENLLAQNPNAKTVALSQGELHIRKQSPEFVRDQQVLLNWCRNYHPEHIRIKEEPDWAGIKATGQIASDGRFVTKDGEPVEGVMVVPKDPSFKVVLTEEVE